MRPQRGHRGGEQGGQAKDYSGVFLGTILLGIIVIVLMLTMAQSPATRAERWPFITGASAAPTSLLQVVHALPPLP